MKDRKFKSWIETFRHSINGYNYYVDFEKVYRLCKNLKVEINILNSLISSETIETEFENILLKYPECLKAIPILIAVRSNEIYCQNDKGAVNYKFNEMTQSIEEYKYFMRETGLFDMLEKHIVNNLYDYIMGVETGLDSNGRKNRGGHQMEDLVEKFIKKTKITYNKEMYLTEVEKEWNVDLSPISGKGTTTKRWDFVVESGDIIYLIETNFYSSGGSKLNETARSYKMIAEEAKLINGVEFLWITDGGGWLSARRNLEETFNTMDYIYNIADMEKGALTKLFQQL